MQGVTMARKKSGLVVVREPNGRLSRTTEAAINARAPAAVKRLMQAAMSGMADKEWGTELGRLLLGGKIDEPLFEAGLRWARLVTQYYKATNTPSPHPRSAAFVGGGKAMEPDPDSEEGQKIAEIEIVLCKDMQEAHGVLFGAGMLAERQVRATCEHGALVVTPHELLALRTGLEWLALHWGLTTQPKNVR